MIARARFGAHIPIIPPAMGRDNQEDEMSEPTTPATPDLNQPGLTISTPPQATEPAPTAPQANEPAPQSDQDETNPEGKGSKQAVLADLAAERDKRQALESQFAGLKDALLTGLGVKSDQVTPEQLAEQLTAEKGAAQQARLELAIFRSAPEGVDVGALLDSRAFTDAIAGIDPTDQAKIAAAITAAVETSPRFKTTPANPAPGARAAAAGGARPAPSMDDWLRGALTK